MSITKNDIFVKSVERGYTEIIEMLLSESPDCYPELADVLSGGVLAVKAIEMGHIEIAKMILNDRRVSEKKRSQVDDIVLQSSQPVLSEKNPEEKSEPVLPPKQLDSEGMNHDIQKPESVKDMLKLLTVHGSISPDFISTFVSNLKASEDMMEKVNNKYSPISRGILEDIGFFMPAKELYGLKGKDYIRGNYKTVNDLLKAMDESAKVIFHYGPKTGNIGSAFCNHIRYRLTYTHGHNFIVTDEMIEDLVGIKNNRYLYHYYLERSFGIMGSLTHDVECAKYSGYDALAKEKPLLLGIYGGIYGNFKQLHRFYSLLVMRIVSELTSIPLSGDEGDKEYTDIKLKTEDITDHIPITPNNPEDNIYWVQPCPELTKYVIHLKNIIKNKIGDEKDVVPDADLSGFIPEIGILVSGIKVTVIGNTIVVSIRFYNDMDTQIYGLCLAGLAELNLGRKIDSVHIYNPMKKWIIIETSKFTRDNYISLLTLVTCARTKIEYTPENLI